MIGCVVLVVVLSAKNVRNCLLEDVLSERSVFEQCKPTDVKRLSFVQGGGEVGNEAFSSSFLLQAQRTELCRPHRHQKNDKSQKSDYIHILNLNSIVL